MATVLRLVSITQSENEPKSKPRPFFFISVINSLKYGIKFSVHVCTVEWIGVCLPVRKNKFLNKKNNTVAHGNLTALFISWYFVRLQYMPHLSVKHSKEIQ